MPVRLRTSAADGEPDAQEPRQESRPVHKQPQRKEPKTPKYLGDNKSVTMQIEDQHGQSILLSFSNMDRKSAPRTRTRTAMAFSSFRNAIGIETTINVAMSEACRRFTPLGIVEDMTSVPDHLFSGPDCWRMK
jgi:hypothetical protein